MQGVTRGDRLISQEALEVYESEKKRLKLRAESLHELGRLEGAVVYHSLILLGVVMVTEGVIIDQDSILALRRFKLAILGH